MTETIVELHAIPVVHLAGESYRPQAEEARKAVNRLEARLPTVKRRRFYGAVVGGEYRACVAERRGDERLGVARWILPGGRYRRARIADWEAHRDMLGRRRRIWRADLIMIRRVR